MNKLFEEFHKEAPFGMFIHWGLYTLTNYQEQYLMRTRAKREDYEPLLNYFNPTEYDPEKWVLSAKAAGMKYICFTTKHHEGFCLWDTKCTDYNIMNTPYNKDALKMLQEACEKHDMNLSLYYSVPDWHHANAYNDRSTHQIPPRDTDEPDMEKYKLFVKKQITELLTQYGKISTLFWDIEPQYVDLSMNELVRELQPEILINDRGFDPGDFKTPERYLPDGHIFPSPTEACESIGCQSWAYRPNEDYHSINHLKQCIDKITSMGGNYLLNVGPLADGRFPEVAENILGEIGKWHKNVEEAIVGTEPIELFTDKEGMLTTIKGQDVYLHVYEGLTSTGLVLDPVVELPQSVVLLNDNSTPRYELCMIPRYYEREDWHVKYLHIYDLPCNELTNEPAILKLTFPEGCDIKKVFKGNVEK